MSADYCDTIIGGVSRDRDKLTFTEERAERPDKFDDKYCRGGATPVVWTCSLSTLQCSAGDSTFQLVGRLVDSLGYLYVSSTYRAEPTQTRNVEMRWVADR